MKKIVALFATALAAGGVLLPSAAGHPHNNPFDNTIFAPIQPGGLQVTLEPVATGLTAPNKGVVAPGEPGRLYVVDQVGKVWAIDLATGSKTVFLDIGTRLVPLGVFGPGSFDERGLLGVAFHPNYAVNGKLYTYTWSRTPGRRPSRAPCLPGWRPTTRTSLPSGGPLPRAAPRSASIRSRGRSRSCEGRNEATGGSADAPHD